MRNRPTLLKGTTVVAHVAVFLLLGALSSTVFAQEAPTQDAGRTILGMDQTTAIIAGIVLALVIILAAVAASRGEARSTTTVVR